MSRLTTHVLDTARGRPARGLRIELFRTRPETIRLCEAVTNEDGRCDQPLLADAAFTGGEYELRFHAGEYLERLHPESSEAPFLDVIPIRFTVANADEHYHVPLLLSPYGYSTYRGS